MKYCINAEGVYLGGWSEDIPEDAIEVPSPPDDANSKYVNGTWIPVARIPTKVTMRQARLALHNTGRLAAVELAINTLPEPPRTAARIEWDYASEVHRDSPFVTLLNTALELDKQSLDDLFLKAREL